MRIPFDATGAVGRTYIALAPEIVAAILRTLQIGWAAAEIDGSVAAAGEVEITERLRDSMRATLKSGRLPWGKSLIIAPGTESRSTVETITPDGRTDIPVFVLQVFLRYEEHDPHAIIECKRLDGTDTHLCREYVVEGVDRFRTGKYGENHAAGFMAGYLIRGDVVQAVNGVNAYLSRVGRTSEALVASAIMEEPGFHQSVHERPTPRAVILVHHALLEVF